MQQSGSTKYIKAVLNLLTAVVLLLLVIFVLPRLLGLRRLCSGLIGCHDSQPPFAVRRLWEQKIKIEGR